MASLDSRLLQVNIVRIISYFLSTISFSLQLHFKQPWVRGKSLRGFSLAAMTALLMSCSPSWPMAKMLLLTSLLSILFNNNLLEVVREEEKGVQHAFNIKMGKYSDRCEAEGILFSWRLWESLSSRRCYIYTRWDNDQERILKTIFFTVKSILEWGSWWTQLPLGWVQTGIFNFFSSSSGTSRRGESPQYCSTTFPYYSLLLSADTPCPSDYHFISCVPAEPRLVQGRGRRELS